MSGASPSSSDDGPAPTSSFRRAPDPHGILLRSRTTFFSHALHISGSVLPRIFPSVICITLYASIIAIGDLLYDRGWKTSNSVVGPLSVVVGLLVVFRNGTSYDRWYEGRKVWQDASATVKNGAVLVWCNVAEGDGADGAKRLARRERKRRAVRLLVAFMVAVKHHLRGEYGCHWKDLQGLLPEDWKGLRAGGSYTLQQETEEPCGQGKAARGKSVDVEAHPAVTVVAAEDEERRPLLRSPADPALYDDSTDLPSQILTALHVYVAGLQRSSLLPSPPFHGVLLGTLTGLSSSFSSLTRISTTTIPAVYSIHLKQCVLLYLLALPLTLVGELSWRVIPFTTLVAITLMGLEGISSEIEDPFGKDRSDHDLDAWCDELRRDLERLMVEVDYEDEEE